MNICKDVCEGYKRDQMNRQKTRRASFGHQLKHDILVKQMFRRLRSEKKVTVEKEIKK